jgi:hypothetical protein
MRKITTTIKREWLREIVARQKKVEYREIKSYWIRRLADLEPPFLLRLINGMHPRAPEVTVIVRRVRRNSRSGHFELVIGRIVEVRHWNLKHQRPTYQTTPSPRRTGR